MSPSQQDLPGPRHQEGASGRDDFGDADELDGLLADAGAAGLMGQVLAAAGAPAEAGFQVGEDTARRAFRRAFPVPRERRPRPVTRTSVRVAAAALAGGLVLSGAVVAAAAGALPGVAQQTARDMLTVVGVSVPGPDRPAVVHPNQPGTSTEKPAAASVPPDASMDDERTGTGSPVAGPARGSARTDVGKGVAVSGAASGGKSHAGQHGEHGKPAGSPPGQVKKTHERHPNTHHEPSTHKPHPPGTAHAPATEPARPHP